MKRNRLALPALLAFTIAACQQPANDSNIAIDNDFNAAEAANAEIDMLPPSESADAPAEGTDNGFNLTSSEDGDTSAGIPILPEDAAKATIPTQYRGRWGMVAADCTSTRGDAKGLIIVADKTVKFYEALATLKAQRPAIATSFSGLFGFTGEGQTWQKVMTFTRTGNTLKRADEDGTYTYTRCA